MSTQADLDRFGIEEICARAAERLRAEPPGIDRYEDTPGDHRLTPGLAPHPSPRDAAVLLPIIARDGGATVLFTLRSAALPRHAGQISFPGGRADPQDAGPRDTALREAHEEIGLDRAYVRTLGYLDVYLSAGGFRIVPVVGLVDPAAVFRIAPDEVDEIFEVPLAFLMTPDHHLMDSGVRDGIDRRFFVMTYEKRIIWGLTAGILRNLYERLYIP